MNTSTNNIHHRITRFEELVPCKTAFIDARTPGSDKKENFCIIGSGVAENPGQVVHIDIPHSFNVGAARQPNGCKNSHHSHDTAEVFFVHNGEWLFSWGEDGSDGEVTLKQGDTISIPTQLFRGFENIGGDDGFLLSVLGLGDDGSPGKVIWAPYVFTNARTHGLVLLDDGRLIDTAAGDTIPADANEELPPSAQLINSYRRLSHTDMQACVFTQAESEAFQSNTSGHNPVAGVSEVPIIGVANANESMPAGKMGWEHGFQVRRLTLAANSAISGHSRAEEEVIFVHHGSLKLDIEGDKITLQQGDLITVPINAVRSFSASEPVDTIVIRGGNNPLRANFND